MKNEHKKAIFSRLDSNFSLFALLCRMNFQTIFSAADCGRADPGTEMFKGTFSCDFVKRATLYDTPAYINKRLRMSRSRERESRSPATTAREESHEHRRQKGRKLNENLVVNG